MTGQGSSSLNNKLVIDLSYCNNLVSIFESPVGSGNYQAKFEVKIPFLYRLCFFTLLPYRICLTERNLPMNFRRG